MGTSWLSHYTTLLRSEKVLPSLAHFATSQRSCPRQKLYKTHALVGIILFLFKSNLTEAAVQCSEPQNGNFLGTKNFPSTAHRESSSQFGPLCDQPTFV